MFEYVEETANLSAASIFISVSYNVKTHSCVSVLKRRSVFDEHLPYLIFLSLNLLEFE